MNYKHGLTRRGRVAPIYHIWTGMIARCENPDSPAYPSYGGRGITVCAEWRRSVVSFIRDVGPRPSRRHSLERIDNDRGYEPGNVRWATPIEQMRNTRQNVWITIDGETHIQAEWARIAGISPSLLSTRLRSGWSGRALLSRDNANRKLSDDDVRHIRQLAADGVPYRVIAERFGIARVTVSEIVTKTRRKSVA